jgi:uncharacterized protein YdaT
MPWNEKDFPDAFKALNEPVRNKAIEIANAMLRDSKYSKAAIVPLAAAAATQWARIRDIPVRANAVAGPDYHVVPHQSGWAVKAEHARHPTAVYDTKAPAIKRGRELAMRHLSKLVIHDFDGSLQEKRNYRDS